MIPDGTETIVSDPADYRLIVFAEDGLMYPYVITNDNNFFILVDLLLDITITDMYQMLITIAY